MQIFSLPLIIFVALIGVLVQGTPVQAQATRTWVSGVGDDANPCNRTAPCKTFAGAISKTAPLGEINCLDPGGFGAVTITKSITISCDGVGAGVLVSGTNGIVVNVPNAADQVTLQGLDINGVGTGLNGIHVVGSGRTFVHKVKISGFTQNGINLVGTTSARVMIDEALIINNTGGLNVQGAGGVANMALLRNTVVDNNTNFSAQITGPSSLVLIGSTMSGGPTSLIAAGGAIVISYGNNVIRGSGAPTQILPLQ